MVNLTNRMEPTATTFSSVFTSCYFGQGVSPLAQTAKRKTAAAVLPYRESTASAPDLLHLQIQRILPGIRAFRPEVLSVIKRKQCRKR